VPAQHPGHGELARPGEESPGPQQPIRFGVTHGVGVGPHQLVGQVAPPGARHHRSLEGRLALVVEQLPARREGQSPVLVTHPQVDLVTPVGVHLIARSHFHHQEAVPFSGVVHALHQTTPGRHHRHREVESGLLPTRQPVAGPPDAFDPPAPQTHHDQATLGIGEPDHQVGQVPRGDTATFPIEPLILPQPQQRPPPLGSGQLQRLLCGHHRHEPTLNYLE